MNKNKISLGSIFVGILSISFVLYMCLTFKPVEKTINNLFQVYLGGKKIGVIKSEQELHDIIDSEQQEIKDEYQVSKVYSPSGLDIQPITTYRKEYMTGREMYDKISSQNLANSNLFCNQLL